MTGLREFEATGTVAVRPRADATIVDVLRRRAAESPASVAFTFLADGEDDEVALTYGELDAGARAIAARLRETAAPGGRAVLMYEPGLGFVAAFFGCLYAGVAPVPVYPPDPRRLELTLARVAGIAEDAEADVALSSTLLQPLLGELGRLAPRLSRLDWLVTDATGADGADRYEELTPAPADIAFVQYTSGSTGTPKGVVLTHANLMAQSALIHEGYRTTPDTIAVSWTPLSHDMGLLGSVLQPLYAGYHNVLMSPVAFLQRPMRWPRAISKYRATTCGGPNFAYELCARKASPDDVAALDLSCWTLAFNGAEPIRADTIDRFSKVFEGAGFRREAFYPCWGLAESTCVVTGNSGSPAPVVRHFDRHELERRRVRELEPGAPDARTFVGSGRPLHGHTLAIVDPASGRRCDGADVGEIWVRGDCVAAGYWRKPERTDEVFGARLPDSPERWLRTGDLGFLLDGQLFVAGRAKDVIVVRGRNLDAQDIELTVERACPGLRPGCGAAVAVEADGAEALGIAQEVAAPDGFDAEAAIACIRGAVAYEHGVNPAVVALLPPRSIPKTSSGKLRRHAVREALASGVEAIAVDPPAWGAAPDGAGAGKSQSTGGTG